MSTGAVENWLGNIADIGPLYPFVGNEFLMFCVCVALWIVWQISCTRAEGRQYQEELERHGKPESIKQAIDHDGN